MNTRIGWKCVLDSGGRRIFVHKSHADIFAKLKKNHQRNYMWTQLYRSIVSLSSDAPRARILHRSGAIRLISIEGGEIEYYLDSGDVLINALRFGKSSSEMESGLYATRFDDQGKRWEVDSEKRRFRLKETWNGVHYAAVGEDAGDKDLVAGYMANQLFMAYSKEVHKKTVESMDTPPPFSLYYLAGEDYKKPEHGEQIAALIQHASDNNASVNWLVQGRAAVTFKNALTSLKKLPSLNSLKASSAKQEVFFSSPVGTNVTALDKLAQEVGLQRHGKKGYNLNPYYLRSSYVSGNAFSEIAMAGRLSAAAGDGKLKQIGKTFSAAINNPVLGVGLTGAGLAAGATGLISQTAAKTLGLFFAARTGLNIAKGAEAMVDGFAALKHSNTGTGRYFFYENPKQLMEAVKSAKSLAELK